LLLAAFTLVFGVVFPFALGTAPSGTKGFALLLFPGISSMRCSPSLSVAATHDCERSNYVKKVVFPLELLPVVAVATALFHALLASRC
jgi:lipopolysaccharide transport system permease protein